VTFTLSPPVRIAALLGVLATVLIGGSMTMLGRGGDTEAVPHAINPHPFGTKKKPAAAATPANKPAATAAKPKAAKAAPPVARAPQRSSVVVAALKAGLPLPIAKALGQHAIVVVSLYNPYSQVDGISFAEARAGAQLAGVGFVPLNVLSQAQVGKLTEQLGLLPDPGVLIYVRPSTLAAKISGFADKETVAQAAHNAADSTP
jgi:hypothetical protein